MMKKVYEAPFLSKIHFEVEEKLMVSTITPDGDVDDDSVKLPEINIFG